jgi:hypothetical protein
MDMVETVDNSGQMTNFGDPGKPFVKNIGGFYFISHG